MIKHLGVVLVLCAIYGGHIWTSPLVYEDARLVDGSQRGFAWSGVFQPRGLTRESWTLVQSPRASHALNLGLHLLVVGLVWLLFWRLTAKRFIAWAVALIVAFHPVTGESVAYAASRAELIAAIGALLALISVSGHGWRWLGIVPALSLAVMGKETGLVTVALVPLVLWYQGRYALARLMTSAVLCLAVSVLPWAGVYAGVGEQVGHRVDAVTWVGMQSVAVWRLVVLSVAPLWLSVSPDVSMASGWSYAAALVMLVASLETAWRARHRMPLLTLGILGCAIVASPRFLVRTPTSPLNEHQWYLAMPFVACLIVAGLHGILRVEQFARNYAAVGAPHLAGLPSAWDREAS